MALFRTYSKQQESETFFSIAQRHSAMVYGIWFRVIGKLVRSLRSVASAPATIGFLLFAFSWNCWLCNQWVARAAEQPQPSRPAVGTKELKAQKEAGAEVPPAKDKIRFRFVEKPIKEICNAINRQFLNGSVVADRDMLRVPVTVDFQAADHVEAACRLARAMGVGLFNDKPIRHFWLSRKALPLLGWKRVKDSWVVLSGNSKKMTLLVTHLIPKKGQRKPSFLYAQIDQAPGAGSIGLFERGKVWTVTSNLSSFRPPAGKTVTISGSLNGKRIIGKEEEIRLRILQPGKKKGRLATVRFVSSSTRDGQLVVKASWMRHQDDVNGSLSIHQADNGKRLRARISSTRKANWYETTITLKMEGGNAAPGNLELRLKACRKESVSFPFSFKEIHLPTEDFGSWKPQQIKVEPGLEKEEVF